MEERKKEDDNFRKRHFSKIHEKVQNKYMKMQQKYFEKSKSVDSLSTLSEEFVFVEHRYASIDDVSEVDIITTENDTTKVKHSVIIEEVNNNKARLQYVTVRQVSASESETTPIDKYEYDNDSINSTFFGEDFCRMSLESLNEVAKESDENTPSPTPPPTNSIRNKFGSRLSSAVKDKKDKQKNETKEKKSKKKVEKYILSNTKQDLSKVKRVKVATVTVALIEVTGLETDILEEKTSRFLFCRFRLGSEKYKSKVIKSCNADIKWQELFNFNLFEDTTVEVSLWDKDFCIGRSFIDLTEMEKERTHKMRINLEAEVGNTTAQIFILLTISGISLANTLVDLDDYQETQNQLATAKKKFAWYHLTSTPSVGKLSVIVYGAKGVSGHDCYCVLELNNQRLQTHTDFKTNEPNWMKIFIFDLNDVTKYLDISVYDERKSEEIGKISIPLLRIKNEEKKWYALKDANLRDRARGNNPRILVEMKLTWNLVRASHRVINPKEVNYLESVEKLDRHTIARHLSRAKAILNWILYASQVFKSFLEWESRRLNFITLVLWLSFCWNFKVWMLPLLFLIPFVWYLPKEYVSVNWKSALIKKPPIIQEEKKEEKNQSLRQKINSLQEMVQTAQNFIGGFANLGESIKNLFNFTVPFLSFFAIFLIVAIAFVMFLIPTKYIFMVWGIHKFTRKTLRPNRIPNNELLDLLSRVPNDEILLDCQELDLEEVLEEDVIK